MGNNWYIGSLALFIILIPLIHKIGGSLFKTIMLLIASYLVQLFALPAIASIDFGQDKVLWRRFWMDNSIVKHMPTLLLGVLLYYLIFEFKLPTLLMERLENILGQIWTDRLIYAIFAVISLCTLGAIMTYQSIYTFSTLFACLIFLLFMKPIWVIHNSVFNSLGKYSYGIYLFHILILGRVNGGMVPILGNSVWNVLCSLVITIVICLTVSIIAAKYYEKPAIDFLNRMIDRKKR